MRACHYTIPVSLSMGQTKTHGHAVNTEVGIDIDALSIPQHIAGSVHDRPYLYDSCGGML